MLKRLSSPAAKSAPNTLQKLPPICKQPRGPCGPEVVQVENPQRLVKFDVLWQSVAMKRYIPKKGDRVMADGRNGTFVVLKTNVERAVADLQLIGKRHIVRDVPFAHIHLL
jgi:hypothetical protein